MSWARLKATPALGVWWATTASTGTPFRRRWPASSSSATPTSIPSRIVLTSISLAGRGL